MEKELGSGAVCVCWCVCRNCGSLELTDQLLLLGHFIHLLQVCQGLLPVQEHGTPSSATCDTIFSEYNHYQQQVHRHFRTAYEFREYNNAMNGCRERSKGKPGQRWQKDTTAIFGTMATVICGGQASITSEYY